jgi:hypothetical protein
VEAVVGATRRLLGCTPAFGPIVQMSHQTTSDLGTHNEVSPAVLELRYEVVYQIADCLAVGGVVSIWYQVSKLLSRFEVPVERFGSGCRQLHSLRI